MRMKNFIFKSSLDKDLLKILQIIQSEQRANRDDNQYIIQKINTLVKGMSLLVTTPEPEDSEPPTVGDLD